MLSSLDAALLRLLRTRGHGPLLELAVLRYSRLGAHGGLWLALAAIGAALDPARRGTYARSARAVLLTYVANTLVKLSINRARPLLEDLPALAPTATGLSYPSAHASMAFAGARSLARALPATPLYAAALVMALSRPYVGVHYPSDVLAGALLGTAVAELAP